MTKMEQTDPKRLPTRQKARVWHAARRMDAMHNRYERTRDLPRLVPMWPSEMAAADASVAGHLKLIGLLAKALRIERRCGVAGRWTYDAGRHRNLVAAIAAERELCKTRWGVRPQTVIEQRIREKVRSVVPPPRSRKEKAPPEEIER